MNTFWTLKPLKTDTKTDEDVTENASTQTRMGDRHKSIGLQTDAASAMFCFVFISYIDILNAMFLRPLPEIPTTNV